MHILELSLIAVGLSMDAFAVALSKGLSMGRAKPTGALVVGAYFGVFQAVMPLIGYWAGARFAGSIQAYDHWIAFILLGAIGGKMLFESLRREGCADRACPADSACPDRACPDGKKPDDGQKASVSPRVMLPLAVATSIDALAIGVSLAFLQVNILPAVSLIGATTFALSACGVAIGRFFGRAHKKWAELAGGVILILMGLKILLEHLGILG